MEKITIKDREFVKEIKDPLRKAGKVKLTVLLLNDSYKGFDKICNLEFNVLPTVERSTINYSEEDLKV